MIFKVPPNPSHSMSGEMGIQKHPLGQKNGNGDWTKINRGYGEQGWDFAGHYAGEFAIRMEVSRLCAQESAFKFNQARKQLGPSPVQWELCVHRDIPWWKTASVVAAEGETHDFGEGNGRRGGKPTLMCVQARCCKITVVSAAGQATWMK